MYYEYEYSVSLILSVVFSWFLMTFIDAYTLQFSEPETMQRIARVTIISYLFGVFILYKTEFRRKFYF